MAHYRRQTRLARLNHVVAQLRANTEAARLRYLDTMARVGDTEPMWRARARWAELELRLSLIERRTPACVREYWQDASQWPPETIVWVRDFYRAHHAPRPEHLVDGRLFGRGGGSWAKLEWLVTMGRPRPRKVNLYD